MNKLLCFILLFCVVLLPATAAERRYMGVWQRETGSNIITGPMSFSAFVEKGTELTKKGLRLIDVETFGTGNTRRYVGVWRGGSGGNLIFPPMTAAQFESKRLEMIDKGMRLDDFEVFANDNGARMFVGVWRSGTGAERWESGLRFRSFVKRGEQLVKQGLRLVDVETLGSGRKRLYFGLWQSGTGSNLVFAPVRAQAFASQRQDLTAKGMRLIDLEVVREEGAQMYITVWAGGPGENRINLPLDFNAFVSRGESMVKQGYRLASVETFEIPTSAPPPGEGPSQPGTPAGDSISFAPLPSYIRLSDDPRLIIDFSSAIDDPPRITIPVDFLPLLPVDPKGEIIFPDNFCGIRVRKASRFVFLKDGEQINEFPFNNVPENSSVHEMFGDNFFLGGIDFTGPIGACASASAKEDWRFFFPFTQSSEAGGPADAQAKLVIEMQQGSEIEFLNFLQIKKNSLKSYQIFKDHTKEKMKKISELLAMLELDDGYCSIDRFVQEMCEDAKKDGKPGECLIGSDFQTPC